MGLDKKNIVFIDVFENEEKKIREYFPNASIEKNKIGEDEIIKKYKNAEILCVFVDEKITAKIIKNLKNLKLIVARSVGYDHIDIKAAKEKNIKVCNIPDYGSHVISEHVFALLLSGARHIREGDERVESKKFDYRGLCGVAMRGKTMGIIGTGKIGKNTIKIASLGFGMTVIANDKYPDKKAMKTLNYKYVSLEEIWKRSDVISLHTPLLKSTHHLINDESIKKMKDGVIIINTARGEIIDTDSLVRGLKSKKIKFAGLDVLEHEKKPELDAKLIDIPNVITTPHIAFFADCSTNKIFTETIETIQKFLNKKDLPHLVS